MKIEEALCRAFCDGITVSEVPVGLSVSTPFEDTSGERIGFYLVRDKSNGLYRIEDDGELVPSLLASGVNILKGSRGKLFQSLLAQGRIEFDAENGELRTPLLEEADVPAAAMRFVALLVRVASLSSVHPGAGGVDGVLAVMSLHPPRDEQRVFASTDNGRSWFVVEDGLKQPVDRRRLPG